MNDKEIIDGYENALRLPRPVLELRYMQAKAIIEKMAATYKHDVSKELRELTTEFAMRGIIRLNDDSPTLRDMCALLRNKHDSNSMGEDMALSEFTHTVHIQECDGWKYKFIFKIEKRGAKNDAGKSES